MHAAGLAAPLDPAPTAPLPPRAPQSTSSPRKCVPAAAWRRGLSVLFFTESHNSMSQRLKLLLESHGHRVRVETPVSERSMAEAYAALSPDLVLCPFLKTPVPESVWRGTPTPVWIVHPGVPGDRGPHSIDHAILDAASAWGVTVVEADEVMDAGAVWGWAAFPMDADARDGPAPPPALTKAAVYRSLTVPAAVRAVRDALARLRRGEPPAPQHGGMPGRTLPAIDRAGRTADLALPAARAVRLIRASDSAPGARVTIAGAEYFAYGASEHPSPRPPPPLAPPAPGAILGFRDGAVLVAAGAGTALWISHLRRPRARGGAPEVKLKAASVLPPAVVAAAPALPPAPLRAPLGERPQGFCESWYAVDGEARVAYVFWETQGAALGAAQSGRLAAVVRAAAGEEGVGAVVLMGGASAFCNGIDLNEVVAAGRVGAAAEAGRQLEAINDVVRAVFSVKGKAVVAALAGGAGAGGAMLAAAADIVWAHGDVVLSPHYRAMALCGSEFWTFFLPRRVGTAAAAALSAAGAPVCARTALSLGLVDRVLSPSREGFGASVGEAAAELVASGAAAAVAAAKDAERDGAWHGRVEACGEEETRKMDACFASDAFWRAAEDFVHKAPGSGAELANGRFEHAG